MTNQEAIDEITSNDYCAKEMDTVASDIGQALDMAIKALENKKQKMEECDFCRTLKTYIEEDATTYESTDLTSKYSVKLFQRVKAGKSIKGEIMWHEYKLNYCPECGQAIDLESE